MMGEAVEVEVDEVEVEVGGDVGEGGGVIFKKHHIVVHSGL